MSLTDAQWARIEPLLPDRTPRRGGRWRDHRQVIDAIAFKYRTGTPWMDLPQRFGSWKGAYSRLRTWAIDGAWEVLARCRLPAGFAATQKTGGDSPSGTTHTGQPVLRSRTACGHI
ncbi:transposase [Streptomyces sp. NPDC059874]|uniref:transposase n=1 Tax=Streptomyces sp. NPDC059874 TaxID=3346983 RepID=UPI00364DB0F5